MILAEIKRTQRRVHTLDDGWWGPASMAACKKHLIAMMPKPHPFPKADQVSLTQFYGPAGNVSMMRLKLPFRVFLYGRREDPISYISVHVRLAASLKRVFERLLEVYPTEEERAVVGITEFFGVYNNRLMRGGALPSLHARAAAIDLDAHRNGNATSWPHGSFMPIEVLECFAAEGWLSAGAFWGRDGMHFQATQ